MFIFYFYIFPNVYRTSIVLMIGFIVIIIGFFIFINLNQAESNPSLFQFKFLSENSIKLIFIILMSISLLIAPISKPKTIIIWNKIGIANYIRAIVIIICCAFLPGANLYNIFFPEKNLHERFKVEPFILKLTLYPLLSFSFIGISVLILDQIGLNRIFIGLVLFLLIVGLLISDMIIQQIRNYKTGYKLEIINISKYTFVILIISFGVILISLGIHFGMPYLIPGDSWIGLAPNNYIGTSDTSPIEWGKINIHYPIFWSYVSFGLSILSGLPYFNTNALLAPFSYLYITSLYLLIKTILFSFKEKYIVLSTILISISSSLFYIRSDYGHGSLPAITFVCEFYFIYKSYAYLLFIVALAFFLIISKTSINEDDNDNQLYKNGDFKLLILAAFFLIISCMLYIIPLLMGIIFIFLYCIFSIKKVQNFRYLTHFLFYITLIFLLFDILMEFYLSESLFYAINVFFKINLSSILFGFISSSLFVYSIFFGLFITSILVKLIYRKYLEEKSLNFDNITFNSKSVFKNFLFVFTALFIIEIIVIILDEQLNYLELNDKITFFYYLDLIFLKIGFISIVGIYLSYYCFKKNRELFNILISWIIFTIIIASVLIYIYWFNSNSIFLKAINKRGRFYMNFWFNRIWFYAIIPLCILTSIGLIKVSERTKSYLKLKNLFSSKNNKIIIKYSSFALLIFLSYTNLIFAAIWSGNINNRPQEEKIELLGWMSENIDRETNILIEEDYIIRVGIFSMVNGRYYFIDDIFESDATITENIEEIDYLKDHDIEYMLIHEDYLYGSSNRSKFIRNYLRPLFYNESEYETNHYRLYYAPYFD